MWVWFSGLGTEAWSRQDGPWLEFRLSGDMKKASFQERKAGLWGEGTTCMTMTSNNASLQKGS
jgi:hypothetical protein